jgi:hypothetical protein
MKFKDEGKVIYCMDKSYQKNLIMVIFYILLKKYIIKDILFIERMLTQLKKSTEINIGLKMEKDTEKMDQR